MTAEELEAFEERFNEIMKLQHRIRNVRLVNLMNDLERCYSIPLLNNADYNLKNPEVMELYQKVSMARDFKEV
ncbi:hypothetical protein MST22_15630 [Virgibacillus halodenitrificans]|uniref:hypothetical protein n=1 Tax=Virgibacillus halodenitrificans TaxID=1482 RepID=UPI001FB4B6D2|nr:hypothetical protein [Virgibacillus halodenitrificans]MCJ0932578.1 hypothetical protein [Virgibacillus halodenitrificans]